MDCLLEKIGQSDKYPHLIKWMCRRCGRVGHFLPEITVAIGPDCQGWAMPSEVGIWVDGLARAVGLKPLIPPDAVPMPPLGKGPGTELKKILSELGVSPTSGCNCEAVAQEMDLAWSVGKFNEHLATYLEHLQKSYDEADVLTKLRAWGNAKMQGKPCTLAGLLTLAIERSAAQA
jgi:hypothetical protein